MECEVLGWQKQADPVAVVRLCLAQGQRVRICVCVYACINTVQKGCVYVGQKLVRKLGRQRLSMCNWMSVRVNGDICAHLCVHSSGSVSCCILSANLAEADHY